MVLNIHVFRLIEYPVKQSRLLWMNVGIFWTQQLRIDLKEIMEMRKF